MNEQREALAIAIKAHQVEENARKQIQEALQAAAECLDTIKAKKEDLERCAAAEIASQGRAMVEAFSSGADVQTMGESDISAQLLATQRLYAAAEAAHADIEAELSKALESEKRAEGTVMACIAAVLRAESSDIAAQIEQADQLAETLRNRLKALDALHSSIRGQHRFLAAEAVNAIPQRQFQYARAHHPITEHTAAWRDHLAALKTNPNHMAS